MTRDIAAYRLNVPLVTPHRLPFASLTAFETTIEGAVPLVGLCQGENADECAAANIRDKTARYNRVGYVLSQAKDNESATMDAREEAVARRRAVLRKQSAERLETIIDGATSTAGPLSR